jgi:uncharacterized protein
MITWDEHKRLRNLADHGVDLDDLDGFFDGELLTMEDVREAYGEIRFRKRGPFPRSAVVCRLGTSWR